MKIAVSAEGPSIEADVCPRFGRCPYFVLADTDSDDFSVLKNEAASQGSGAGVQSARLIYDKAVRHVLTGECGPNASEALAAAGIQVALGCRGTVREAIRRFTAESSEDSERPDNTKPEDLALADPSGDRSSPVTQTSGAASPSMGRGGGLRRGRGHGRGRGRAAGQGIGRGFRRGAGRG